MDGGWRICLRMWALLTASTFGFGYYSPRTALFFAWPLLWFDELIFLGGLPCFLEEPIAIFAWRLAEAAFEALLSALAAGPWRLAVSGLLLTVLSVLLCALFGAMAFAEAWWPSLVVFLSPERIRFCLILKSFPVVDD